MISSYEQIKTEEGINTWGKNLSTALAESFLQDGLRICSRQGPVSRSNMF